MTLKTSPPTHANTDELARTLLRGVNRRMASLDRLARAPNSSPTEPLFVVGLPRSGTTLTYELIVQAFNVSYLTKIYSYVYGLPNLTTRLASRFTGSPTGKFRSTRGRIPGVFSPAENHVIWTRWFEERPHLGHYVPAQLVNRAACDEADSMISSMTTIAGKTFVFKDVYLTLSIPALIETIRSARIVVVRRDIGEVATSLYNARNRIGTSKWWSIRPPFFAEMMGRDLVEQVAFQVVRTEQLLERSLRQVADKFIYSVTYEDICTAPQEFLRSLKEWSRPTLQFRPNADWPRSFPHKTGPGIPIEIGERLADLITTLQADRDQYLARVDAHVAERLAERC